MKYIFDFADLHILFFFHEFCLSVYHLFCFSKYVIDYIVHKSKIGCNLFIKPTVLLHSFGCSEAQTYSVPKSAAEAACSNQLALGKQVATLAILI